MTRIQAIAILCAVLLTQHHAVADTQYQETTQMTGGSMLGMMKMAGKFNSQVREAGEPKTSTVMIHGDRMARVEPHATELIDLDHQTVTFIDTAKRQYWVTTFTEMRDAMNKGVAHAKSSQNPNHASDAQLKFDVHLHDTGAVKQIDGREAKEFVLTTAIGSASNDSSDPQAAMATTSSIWIVASVPGETEMRRFNQRMAQELGMDLAGGMASMLSTQPGSAQALAEAKKESAKMKGMPVLQVVRVGVSPDGQPLPPSSDESVASHPKGSGAGSAAGEIATDTGTQTANNEIGKLGGFGRALGGSTFNAMMKRKPSHQEAPTAQSNGTDTPGVLLESSTRRFNFSEGPVDLASFDVPAGYKQIASPLQKH